ncbi:MAG: ShlB/FhaC/HecB family hemolysin secretion/activation protein, partial [Aquincola sp.]|nr:ShlB/FhaC/HecB family hemolysin secretion/activation protein [Aquincola sp.]
DRGQVRVNVDNRQVGASPNHYVLQGAGATLVWRGPQASELRLTWARRLGHNPNATSTGQDQDGSHQRNRLWLQAAIAF